MKIQLTSRSTPRFKLKSVSLALMYLASSSMALANNDAIKHEPKTATPIKHVIVLIGENRKRYEKLR